MSEVKLLHIADLHIGAQLSYLAQSAESRRFEVANVFKTVVETCKNEGVQICLIAGDLFHSNMAAQDFSSSVFEHIRNTPEVKFFYVAGNHDPLNAASPMCGENLPENLFVFGGQYEILEFPEMSLRVIGKSFLHSSMEAEPFSRTLPDDGFINIMLLHADALADPCSPYNPINRDFIENCSVDYLALGHIHKKSAPAKIGNTYFAYAGCPEGQGFDEDGLKGGYIGTLSKTDCNLSFVRLCRRVHRVLKIDISEASSSINAADIILGKLSSDYGEGYVNDLYKIVLTGAVAKDVTIKKAEVLQILSDKLYFIKIKDKTRKAYDLDALKNEASLKGIFVKKMLERIEKAEEPQLPLLNAALELGLSAFDSEVAYNED